MSKWSFYTTNELKPKGWLLRQLEIQAEGLCGNLDKVWPDIAQSAWIGGDREGWERVPYWLDGFIPLAYLLENDDMVKRAKKYIDTIIAAQQDDGWICPCPDSERENYDSWAVLLITKVLTVYYDCSKDERVPDVIYRVLKNYYTLLSAGKIRLFEWAKYRWYEGFIAINFTYERYKEGWLLELAEILKEQGADYNQFVQLWQRPLNYWRQKTHIVNIAMMLKHEAVSFKLLGQHYTDNAEYLHDILQKYNSTAVEVFTGDECLSGLSPIQGTELCAVVEQMYSYELLYAITGQDKWAERLEVIAFNALPAAVSDDMWAHQYDQMSNQISCQRFPGKPIFSTNGREAHLFGLEPNSGCCTANFGQGWPKLALSAFMHSGNTVISCIGIPAELITDDKHIILETNYPFENSFKYSIEAKKGFTFAVRIPSFAENVMVNGKRAEGGHLEFDIAAGSVQEIDICFDTSPRFEKRPYGLNTVKYGSLVFSVPIKYEKKKYEYEKDGVIRKYPYCDYEYLPLSDWSYGFADKTLVPEKRPLSSIPFSSENPPLVIKANVQKIGWGLEERYLNVCAKVPCDTAALSQAEQILLYPYGCAKLRMTELPFATNKN